MHKFYYPHHSLIQDYFHHPQKKLGAHWQSLPVLPATQLLATLICSLSQWLCLFWTFHINGTIHVTLCVWFLLLNIMFSGFIHTERVSVLHSSHGCVPFHCWAAPHFVYPFVSCAGERNWPFPMGLSRGAANPGGRIRPPEFTERSG